MQSEEEQYAGGKGKERRNKRSDKTRLSIPSWGHAAVSVLFSLT